MPTHGDARPDRHFRFRYRDVPIRVEWSERFVPHPRYYVELPAGRFFLGHAEETDTRDDVRARLLTHLREHPSHLNRPAHLRRGVGRP